MNRSVCILYGLNEGPDMGRKLVAVLQQNNFSVSNDPRTAAIIFAHSGGCYVIPEHAQAQHILLVGLPYWPQRSWLSSTIRKVRREAKTMSRQHTLRMWWKKWCFHIVYAFNFKAALRMAANRNPDKPWNSPKKQIIIRNRFDEYCCPEVMSFPFKGSRAFISLAGEHDDCWDNPDKYVNLLQSLVDGE